MTRPAEALYLRYFLLWALFFCVAALPLHAQHNNFQTYSYQQGLSQSTIFTILQDERGYLWLGTDKGLVRYDGITFRTFGKGDGFKAGVVRSLMHDQKGRLWVGTQDNGIIVYDGRTFSSITGLKGSSVLCMLEDKNGTVWAGTDDGGINRIEALRDSFSVEVIDESNGLSNKSVVSLLQRSNGEIWMATFGGINIISTNKDPRKIRQLRGGQEIPGDQIMALAEDSGGNVWCARYNENVFRVSDAGGKLVVKEFGAADGFTAKGVWKITCTSEQDIWFATSDDGLIRYQEGKKFFHYTSKDGVAGNQVLCVYEDKERNLWIGTNGKGLCKFGGDVFAHYDERDGILANSVSAIAGDENGLWLGTAGGGLLRFNPQEGRVGQVLSTTAGLKGNSIVRISVAGQATDRVLWLALGADGIARYDARAPEGKQFIHYTEADGMLGGFVYTVLADRNGIVWCGTPEGISRFDGVKFVNLSMEAMKFSDKGVYTILEDTHGNLWFGTESGLATYTTEGELTTFEEADGLTHKEVNSLAEDVYGNIWIGTVRNGVYVYEARATGAKKIRFVAGDSILGSGTIRSLLFENNEKLLVGTDRGFCRLHIAGGKVQSFRQYDASNGFRGIENLDNAIFKINNQQIYFGTFNGLTRYNPAAEKAISTVPRTHLTSLQLFFKDVNWRERSDSLLPWFNLPQRLVLPYTENHLTFQFIAIALKNPEQVRYKYMLEGIDKDWSPERKETSVTFSALAPGTYTFKLIAAGENGVWNPEPLSYTFTITPPWYRTRWFYVASALFIALLVYSFIKFRERALVREKKVLEVKVQERTAEIVKQKEHIEEQKKEIMDSINYARRIQGAVLTPLPEIQQALPDSFVLFKPKDIVSGDFYWFHQSVSLALIGAADCTGHGVPGAFMSMLGSEKLNEAVLRTEEPGKLLQSVNRLIKKVLRQSASQESTRDGMDVALCAFSKNSRQVVYAGANRPLWIVRAGSSEVEEIKATKAAIGGFTDDLQEFTQHTVSLNKGDTLYIFSDGYADQFGVDDKKFMTKRFKELLISLQGQSMDAQKMALDSTIDGWRGHMEQTDDILVIGVRVDSGNLPPQVNP
jgi:ligand-binding sensor domain-containing protein/serine phosphatase RsbU (regulator of sigma subunit)